MSGGINCSFTHRKKTMSCLMAGPDGNRETWTDTGRDTVHPVLREHLRERTKDTKVFSSDRVSPMDNMTA